MFVFLHCLYGVFTHCPYSCRDGVVCVGTGAPGSLPYCEAGGRAIARGNFVLVAGESGAGDPDKWYSDKSKLSLRGAGDFSAGVEATVGDLGGVRGVCC